MNSAILKSETQDLHNKIEDVMHSSLIFTDRFTTAHYQHFILKSYAYLHHVTSKENNDWAQFDQILTQKKQALTEDLNHLNLEIEQTSKTSDSKENKFYNLGQIYIVLGAMLGNKMILKKLKEYPSFVNYPFEYLSKHQDNLGEIWKNFQSIINELETSDLEQVIQGARDGYVLFGE